MSGADPAPSPTEAQPVFQKRNRGNIRKRPAEDQTADEVATDLKVPKLSTTAPAVAFSTKRVPDERVQPFQFQSNRTVQQAGDQGLFKTLETETEFDKDARYVFEAWDKPELAISCQALCQWQGWHLCLQSTNTLEQ